MELRWDPVLGEWVLVSNIRSRRPWRPKNYCPFCPGGDETGYGWDVLLIENKYPMLKDAAPKVSYHSFYRKSRAIGRCYVLIETPKHDLDDISDLTVNDIVKVINEFRRLTAKVMREGRYVYVLWFRNKGKEVGVSLTHPHSQVYVLPFTPSKVMRELQNARIYWLRSGSCIFCDVLKHELSDRIRIVYEGNSWVAFIPFYAHWPYEVHIYPKRHVGLITELNTSEVSDLARTIKVVLCGIKHLFKKPSPYVMVLHQSPIKGKYPYYHLHIEVYGLMRGDSLLKYTGGMELGGGNFTYDSVPEDNAAYLRSKIEGSCINEK